MPIHIAITRRVRAGREAEFEQALREFFQTSFAHGGVWGASMLVPPPNSELREYGILRTFANEQDRDAFYATPLFKAWDERARTMTDGDPEYRELHGLEAWFRSPNAPPPRWKMGAATLLGVFPTSYLLSITIGHLTRELPHVLGTLVFSAAMVALLTWVVMPTVTRFLKPWLHAKTTNPTP